MSWQAEQDASEFLRKNQSLLLNEEAQNNLLLQAMARSVQAPSADNIGFTNAEGGLAFLYNGALIFNFTPSANESELVACVKQTFGPDSTKRITKVIGLQHLVQNFTRAWLSENQIVRITKHFSMILHKLTHISDVQPAKGHMRRAWIEDKDLLTEWYKLFWQETEVGRESKLTDEEMIIQMITSKQLHVWSDPKVVSMAAVGGSTPNGIRMHSVFTPIAKRGKGYAKSVVAGLSRLQLDQGKKFIVLYTDALKPENGELYRKVGYEPISEHLNYVFGS